MSMDSPFEAGEIWPPIKSVVFIASFSLGEDNNLSPHCQAWPCGWFIEPFPEAGLHKAVLVNLGGAS